MYNYLIYLFSILINPNDTFPIIEKTIEIRADKLFADQFDNVYIVSGNTLIKYNSSGQKPISFTSETGEEITKVDIRNPYKVLLFSDIQNKLIILDNNLSVINKDNLLLNQTISNQILICSAYDSGYWIYDKTESRLIKLSSDFKVEFTTDLYFKTYPEDMIAGKTYLLFKSEAGILLKYNYITKNIKEYKDILIYKTFNLNNDLISYFDKSLNKIILFDINTGSFTKEIRLKKTTEDAVVGRNKIFFSDSVNVYISSLMKE